MDEHRDGEGGLDPCLACGARAVRRTVYRQGPWTVVACPACGLGRTHPIPDTQQIGEAYQEEGYYEERGMWGEEGQAPFRQRARRLAGRFGVGTLLDVGCGEGSFLAAARAEGFAVVGSEISETAAARAREVVGLDIREGPFGEEQFDPDEHFGLVTMIHVLEHLPDPLQALATARRLLEPGGHLLVEVPNRESLRARIPHPGRGPVFDLPLHLFHFTPASLKALLLASGFEDIGVTASIPRGVERALGWVERLRGWRTRGKAPEGEPAARDEAGSGDRGSSGPGDRGGSGPSVGARLVEAVRMVAPGWVLRAEARKPMEEGGEMNREKGGSG